MKKLLSVLTISFFIALFYPTKSNAQTKTATDGEFTYEYVENDPLNARVYTLKNGLKVYLSVNKDEPRIYGTISTRAGSKDDPRDATGLAHYLEHMLFKGTDKIGTTNWEAEKKLLDKIEELYEKHRLETNPEVKKAIYKQIDSISFIASGYAAPNEYDKMVSSLGAKGTNAFTSSDQTTYLNDIPANELEKWLELEAERFRMCVLRLFHTELEAVYEEFNMSQDRDGSKVYETMLQALFPTHPYHISTIGLGEHLKNPSMTRIYEFFNNFYVANNMAVVLAGDLDPSTTIRLVNKYFGNMRAGDVKRPTHAPEKNLEAPIVKEVNGTEAEYVQIAYRFDGAGSDDALKLRLVDAIVQNGKCGIMDLNLLQKQQILDGGCYYMAMNDYSTLVFTGTPREGQTLEAVKDLLLEQVEQLKQGKFENWLIDASLRNFKLREIKRMESNSGRVFTMLGSFIQDRPYQDIALEIEKLSKITKSDIVNLANQKLGNNYVVIYKRQGEDKNVMKVEKPPITQVKLDRSKQTEFLTNLISKKSDRLKPVFLDYKKDIKKLRLKNKIELNYVRNEINPTFNLYYILDMGDDNDKKLALAVEYLQYLGTKKYTPEQLKQEFYKLGLSFGVSTSEDQVYVSLSGLEESLQEGIKLFEHILANVKPDQEALNNMIDGILKQREDAKKDKNSIFSALYSYGEYGPKSPQTNILSASELKNITPQELIDQIKKLTSYKHYIFYYGQNTPEKVSKLLDKYHKVPKTLKAYPKPIVFKQQPTTATKVYFVNYDMVQAQILMLSQSQPKFNKNSAVYARLFNNYFGSGLSSIVFQEIREVRALAYSASSSFGSPGKKDEAHYVNAFMAVQADKMKSAITAMDSLLNNMPQAETQFETAKAAVQKQIETERIAKTNKFFNYLNAKKLGLDYDLRKDTYAKAQTITMADMVNFFNSHIKGKKFTYVVMGNKNKLDMDYLKSLGEFKEITLEELFGY